MGLLRSLTGAYTVCTLNVALFIAMVRTTYLVRAKYKIKYKPVGGPIGVYNYPIGTFLPLYYVLFSSFLAAYTHLPTAINSL